MAEAIVMIGAIIFFILLFCSDAIVSILTARKTVQVKIEQERTKQKELDLERAKVKAGITTPPGS